MSQNWKTIQVDDAEDFPESSKAPGLRALENALRCTICKEFLDGPVSLRCGHSFCSRCVRESLAAKQECPTCRTGQQNEGHLRVNPVLEEAVTAWKEARSHVLQIIERVNQPPAPPKKKRKRPDSDSDNDIRVMDSPSSSQNEDSRPRCPICDQHASEAEVNQHIDNGCGAPKPKSNNKEAWSKIMNGNAKIKGKGKSPPADSEEESRLPKVSYDTLKDRQIKELLSQQDLPISGDRTHWIKQYQQWVIIWNANLDKAPRHRKTKPQLKAELAQWLETHQAKSKPIAVADAAAHERKYGKEFARLTEVARPKSKEPETTPPLV